MVSKYEQLAIFNFQKILVFSTFSLERKQIKTVSGGCIALVLWYRYKQKVPAAVVEKHRCLQIMIPTKVCVWKEGKKAAWKKNLRASSKLEIGTAGGAPPFCFSIAAIA